jgi:hypothetical protein
MHQHSRIDKLNEYAFRDHHFGCHYQDTCNHPINHSNNNQTYHQNQHIRSSNPNNHRRTNSNDYVPAGRRHYFEEHPDDNSYREVRYLVNLGVVRPLAAETIYKSVLRAKMDNLLIKLRRTPDRYLKYNLLRKVFRYRERSFEYYKGYFFKLWRYIAARIFEITCAKNKFSRIILKSSKSLQRNLIAKYLNKWRRIGFTVVKDISVFAKGFDLYQRACKREIFELVMPITSCEGIKKKLLSGLGLFGGKFRILALRRLWNKWRRYITWLNMNSFKGAIIDKLGSSLRKKQLAKLLTQAFARWRRINDWMKNKYLVDEIEASKKRLLAATRINNILANAVNANAADALIIPVNHYLDELIRQKATRLICGMFPKLDKLVLKSFFRKYKDLMLKYREMETRSTIFHTLMNKFLKKMGHKYLRHRFYRWLRIAMTRSTEPLVEGFNLYRKFVLRKIYQAHYVAFNDKLNRKLCYSKMSTVFGISEKFINRHWREFFFRWRNMTRKLVLEDNRSNLFFKLMGSAGERFKLRAFCKRFNQWRRKPDIDIEALLNEQAKKFAAKRLASNSIVSRLLKETILKCWIRWKLSKKTVNYLHVTRLFDTTSKLCKLFTADAFNAISNSKNYRKLFTAMLPIGSKLKKRNELNSMASRFNYWRELCRNERMSLMRNKLFSKLDRLCIARLNGNKLRCFSKWKNYINQRHNLTGKALGLNKLASTIKKHVFASVMPIESCEGIKRRLLTGLGIHSGRFRLLALRRLWKKWQQYMVWTSANSFKGSILKNLGNSILRKHCSKVLLSSLSKWKRTTVVMKNLEDIRLLEFNKKRIFGTIKFINILTRATYACAFDAIIEPVNIYLDLLLKKKACRQICNMFPKLNKILMRSYFNKYKLLMAWFRRSDTRSTIFHALSKGIIKKLGQKYLRHRLNIWYRKAMQQVDPRRYIEGLAIMRSIIYRNVFDAPSFAMKYKLEKNYCISKLTTAFGISDSYIKRYWKDFFGKWRRVTKQIIIRNATYNIFNIIVGGVANKIRMRQLNRRFYQWKKKPEINVEEILKDQQKKFGLKSLGKRVKGVDDRQAREKVFRCFMKWRLAKRVTNFLNVTKFSDLLLKVFKSFTDQAFYAIREHRNYKSMAQILPDFAENIKKGVLRKSLAKPYKAYLCYLEKCGKLSELGKIVKRTFMRKLMISFMRWRNKLGLLSVEFYQDKLKKKALSNLFRGTPKLQLLKAFLTWRTKMNKQVRNIHYTIFTDLIKKAMLKSLWQETITRIKFSTLNKRLTLISLRLVGRYENYLRMSFRYWKLFMQYEWDRNARVIQGFLKSIKNREAVIIQNFIKENKNKYAVVIQNFVKDIRKKLRTHVIVKEVPVIKEIIKEVPVIRREVVEVYKEVINTKEIRLSKLRNVFSHIDRLTKFLLLGKYYTHWRSLNINQILFELINELNRKPKEIIKEIIHEVEVEKVKTSEEAMDVLLRKSALRNLANHIHKVQTWFFLGKYFRIWKRFTDRLLVLKIQESANKQIAETRPVEIIREIIKEVKVEVPVTTNQTVVLDKSIVLRQFRLIIAHFDKTQRLYLIGRCFRKWKKVEVALTYKYLEEVINKTITVESSQLNSESVDVTGVQSDLSKNRAIAHFITICNYHEKTTRAYYLGKCFKQWKRVHYLNQINSLKQQLKEKPKEIVKEVMKEVIREVKVQVPIKEIKIGLGSPSKLEVPLTPKSEASGYIRPRVSKSPNPSIDHGKDFKIPSLNIDTEILPLSGISVSGSPRYYYKRNDEGEYVKTEIQPGETPVSQTIIRMPAGVSSKNASNNSIIQVPIEIVKKSVVTRSPRSSFVNDQDLNTSKLSNFSSDQATELRSSTIVKSGLAGLYHKIEHGETEDLSLTSEAIRPNIAAVGLSSLYAKHAQNEAGEVVINETVTNEVVTNEIQANEVVTNEINNVVTNGAVSGKLISDEEIEEITNSDNQ